MIMMQTPGSLKVGTALRSMTLRSVHAAVPSGRASLEFKFRVKLCPDTAATPSLPPSHGMTTALPVNGVLMKASF
jgi:hypothetical protein